MSPLIWVIILIAAIAVTAVVTGVVVSTLSEEVNCYNDRKRRG